MNRSITVRGTLCDPRHIELDQPLTDVVGQIELTIKYDEGRAVEDVVDFIAGLPAGQRSKDDIDREIREERAAWNDR